MKIPTPAEIHQARDAKNAVIIESTIASIVAAMKAGNMNPYIEVPYPVRETVQRRFAEAGWSISFRSDQRDGSWVMIMARA